SPQGDVTTQYDMKSLADIGLLKIDFLGLRTLTVIDHTLKLLKEVGIKIDIKTIPDDDPETYRIFSNGDTVGIFQFESSGMREYLKKLQPEKIEDLTAMNALYRPGPMEMINDFIDRKNGRIPVHYMHPLLKPILEETHGVIIYQEQVTQIASEIGGFSLGKADLLRRAMGKKRPDLMQEQRTAFIQGAMERTVSEDIANSIFDLMDRFAGYGFNKSHATCYSIVAYQTAFLKAHYPLEFMASNLTSEMGNTDRIVILIDECRRMGIDILPPDVNESYYNFIITGKAIRFGLGAIKNVGKSAIQSIIEGRKRMDRFKNIYDFCQNINLRLVNKKVIESLIQVGAMDSLEGNRAQKMAVCMKVVGLAQSSQQNVDMGQTSIFGDSISKTELYPELPPIDPWSQSELLRREKEFIGFYISGHPLLKYEDEINAFAHPKLENIIDTPNGQTIRICGIITKMKNRLDRRDKPMAFFTLEDFTGSVRVIVFSEPYEKFRHLIQNDQMVVVLGNLDRRGDQGESSILATEILPLEQARDRYAKRLSLNLRKETLSDGIIGRIQMLLDKYPGSCQTYLNIEDSNGSEL
ncbi:DNA polymerase III subunit alpha, partial [bacterium]|nr:DNA polymerase III subunit alpha [bacterium]